MPSRKIALLTTTLAEHDFNEWHFNLKNALEKRNITCDLLRNGNFQAYYGNNGNHLFYEGEHFKTQDYGLLINQMSLSHGHTADYYVVNIFEENKIPTFNSISSILSVKNKLSCTSVLSKNNIPVPKTAVVRQREDIELALNFIGKPPYILKEAFGSGGARVMLAESKRSVFAIFDYAWRVNRHVILMVQEYITDVRKKNTDYRVLVINHKFVAAMERFPSTEEFRANVKLGGNAKAVTLSNKEIELCEEITKLFDLKVAGIDFIRANDNPYIIEVNSNPTLHAIPIVAKEFGIDVFGHYADYVLQFFD